MQIKQHNMKAMHKRRSGRESCSCTTCTYNSESDHPSLRRFVTQGSRVDRLYYGKYIPLRERKLLERLVRTRAVYDDIRAQLLSDSTVNLSTKGDFETKTKTSSKEIDDTEKSSGAVLEFVNMVDKGATLGSRKLTDCCSCCSCFSKFENHEHSVKRQRQKRAHAAAYDNYGRERLGEIYNRKKGVRFKAKHIKSDPCTCTLKFSGLMKKHSKSIFKKVHPGPTLPIQDLPPKTDDEMKQKRERTTKKPDLHLKEIITEGAEKTRVQTKKSLDKLSQVKYILTDTVKNSAQKLRARKKKTKTKCFCPEKEIAFQLKKDSISKFKQEIRRKKLMKDWECEPECDTDICVPEECFIKLKQNTSDLKNFQHKGINYNVMTREQTVGDSLQHSHEIENLVLSKTTKTEKQKPILRNAQVHEFQAPLRRIDKDATKNKKLVKIEILNNKGNKNKCHCEIYKAYTRKPNEMNTLTAKLDKKTIKKIKATSKKSKTTKVGKRSLEKMSNQLQAVRIGSSLSFNIEFYKNKSDPKISTNILQPIDSQQYSGIDYSYKNDDDVKNSKKRHIYEHDLQVVLKNTLKNTQTVGYALKRCFCTLKLKAEPKKLKLRQPVKTTKKILKLNDVQTNIDYKPKTDIKLIDRKKKKVDTLALLPYECDPAVCIPDSCDPYLCVKLINMREDKIRPEFCICHSNLSKSRKSQSTSSFRPNPYKYAKAKYVQSTHRNDTFIPVAEKKQIRQRNKIDKQHSQAVRIGSTFSFNVEFYKGKHKDKDIRKLRSLSMKPSKKAHQKTKLKDRALRGNIGNSFRSTPTQVRKKERNARIGTTLKRCFCTLKLQKQETMISQSKKTFTIETETEPKKLQVFTSNKGTKTKSKYTKPLETFECEPFTCIPGACDPYVCLERINKRNIRLKEIGSTTDRNKSTSSSCGCTTYADKSLKAVQIQYKPKHRERKILAKTQKPTEYNDKKSFSGFPSAVKSKQRVKIGSRISFDIEFYKNELPPKEVKYSDPIEKTRKVNTTKKLKNKGITINRLNVAHIDTQVQRLKKHYKGSTVSPLLKRCFCTLNLQKKWRHQYSKNETSLRTPLFHVPRNYIVNRAIISKTRDNPASKYRRNVIQIPVDNSLEKNMKDPVDTRKFNINLPLSLSQNINLTGPTSHFQQCLCAMNLKTENIGILKRHEITKTFEPNKMNNQFLYKPYECEPGVCIPDECNPYECQKMITKRLRRNFSEKSDTRHLSQSISSSAGQPAKKLKTRRQQTLAKNLMRPYVTYKDVPNNDYKQAVRVGSSFSFDIQFSKHLTTSQKCVVPLKYSSDTRLAQNARHESKSKGTVRKKTYDSQSQSTGAKTIQRGTFTMPAMNRCFCTLKLQKKGRIHKQFKSKQLVTPSIQFTKVRTVSRGQNTKFRPLKIAHSLKPYECEPNICIPGQCDPYQCLEAMKRKNYNRHKGEVATSTILHDKKSVSIMTKDNSIKKLHKSNVTNVKPKEYSTKMKMTTNSPEYGYPKPIRQALRVGSSFSFNIEFSKDKSSRLPYYVREESKESKFSKELEPLSKYVRSHRYSQNNKNLRHKPSQIRNLTRPVSTGTISFTKRCFCTARLYQSKFNDDIRKSERVGNSPSIIKKCVCFLQKLKGATKKIQKTNDIKYYNNKNNKKSKTTTIHKDKLIAVEKTVSSISKSSQVKKRHVKSHATGINNLVKRCFCTFKLNKNKNIGKRNGIDDQKFKKFENKSVMTKENSKWRSNSLRPYECEPNFCIPYQCDSKECEKRIKLRHINLNNHEFGNDTFGKLKTKSKSIRNENLHKHSKQRTDKYAHRQNHKQSVRVGSSFDFNIEFFKDTYHGGFNLEKLPKKRLYRKDKLAKQANGRKINKTTPTEVGVQIMKAQSTMTKFLPLKRCFCTLSLRKSQEKPLLPSKTLKASISTETNVHQIPTDPILNLLPYECEPYVCVPDECKLVQCLDRIKRRHKSPGISKAYSQKNNGAFNVTKEIEARNKKTQIKHIKHSIKPSSLHLNPNVIKKPKQKLKNKPFEQAVRIGSNFSFDIEFSKNKIFNFGEKQKLFKNHEIITKNIREKSNYSIKKATRKQQKSFDKNGTHKNIELCRKRKKLSNSSFFKRCFCAFKLHKIGRQQKLEPSLKHKTENTQTAFSTQKDNKYIGRKLESFECEPNVCIPGSCDPYECAKRIRKRLLREKGTKIERPLHISTYSTTSNVPLLKSIKQQTTKTREKRQQINRKIPVQYTDKNVNRQVVSIGSNFSFNVEFYKTNCPKHMIVSNKENFKNIKSFKQGVNDLEKNKLNSFTFQSHKTKKELKSTSKSPFLKRCFCTLRLQKKQGLKITKSDTNHSHDYYSHKLGQRQISTKNKCIGVKDVNKISTKVNRLSAFECEPFYCIPGKCDPYECEKRIKMKKKCKTRNTTTNKNRSQKCVGIKSENSKSQINQTSFIDAAGDSIPKSHFDQTGVVELPKFGNIFNKEAVRIGSNFNFNIEFYKERIPPIMAVDPDYDKPLKMMRKNITHNGGQTINMTNFRNRGSQGEIKTENKFIEAQNVLKRCFCTLELHNKTKFKNETKNMQSVVKRTQFPQTLEVRRVAVQHKPKVVSKQTHFEVKSVATKIDNKHLLKEKRDIKTTCNLCLCGNDESLCFDDMKTTLPYTPKKFNKTYSRTLFPSKNNRVLNESEYNKQKEIMITNHGKRLTRKKSKKYIHAANRSTTREKRSPLGTMKIKSFLCRCVEIFHKKTSDHRNLPPNDNAKVTCSPIDEKSLLHKLICENKIRLNGVKYSKSERQTSPNQLMLNSEPKKSKSLKLGSRYDSKNCKKSCPCYANKTINLLYQCGDIEHRSPMISFKINKKQVAKHTNNNNDDKYKETEKSLNTPMSIKQQITKGNIQEEVLCTHCLIKLRERQDTSFRTIKEHFPPLKVHFLDSTVSKNKLQGDKMNVKKFAKSINKTKCKYEGADKLCPCCHYCGVQINKDLPKARGDQVLNKISANKLPFVSTKVRKGKTDNVYSGEDAKRPLLEMHLDSTSYDILNKDEVIDNVKSANKVTFVTTKVKKGKSGVKKKDNVYSGKEAKRPLLEMQLDSASYDILNKDEVIDNVKSANKVTFVTTKVKKGKSGVKKKDNVYSGKEAKRPLLEMQLDSASYDILNKDEVIDNVTKLNVRSKKGPSKRKYVSKSGEEACRCCVCLEKQNRTGAKITVAAKDSKVGGAFGRLFRITESKLKGASGKPCICGSLVCAKKVQKMLQTPSKSKHYTWKRCVCGSPVCDRESAKIKTIPKELRHKEIAKRKKKLNADKLKKDTKQRALHLKQLSKEDRLRRKKRRKEHKRMEKKINKKTNDAVLLAQTAIDIGKLGVTAGTDILRLVARSTSDPRHAYKTLQTIKENPKLLARHLKSAYDDSGVAATAKRVRLRCLAMKGVRKVRATLERYPITKYLLYITSKDPKRRLVKPQRVRERFDYGCSLYVGSLRKRPFIWIYDRCPGFYPHFLSLINVWKQFMDISLFLLAVVVWSPCILCMELCRAMMCCFFCTG